MMLVYNKPIYKVLHWAHSICNKCTCMMMNVEEKDLVIKCYCHTTTPIDVNIPPTSLNLVRDCLLLPILYHLLFRLTSKYLLLRQQMPYSMRYKIHWKKTVR